MMITDSKYGDTLTIYECQNCKFQFCPSELDLVSLYKDMEDNEYIETSKARKRQAMELANKFIPFIGKKGGATLDVGCGSGLLVSYLHERGFAAQGIEPSIALATYAQKSGLNVKKGLLSDLPEGQAFDFISLVDVIEHVDDPKKLLKQVFIRLKSGGSIFIVTPRIDSFFRKLLGFKWWHYRIAHVGYFRRDNLIDTLNQIGFVVKKEFSPSWYFPLDYILTRLIRYIPGCSSKTTSMFNSQIIKLNLGDSIALFARKE